MFSMVALVCRILVAGSLHSISRPHMVGSLLPTQSGKSGAPRPGGAGVLTKKCDTRSASGISQQGDSLPRIKFAFVGCVPMLGFPGSPPSLQLVMSV